MYMYIDLTCKRMICLRTYVCLLVQLQPLSSVLLSLQAHPERMMSLPHESANGTGRDISNGSSQSVQTIRWPETYQPAGASAFAHNEIVIAAAPNAVWAWLLRAQSWPGWYANASDIRFLSHVGPGLRDGSRFRWKTFGLQVTCEIKEFEAPHRLAWEAHGTGVAAWHAWLLTPLADGSTHVLTEEVQHGWMARLGKMFTPGRMQTQHQLWLEGLSRQAQTGMPPQQV